MRRNWTRAGGRPGAVVHPRSRTFADLLIDTRRTGTLRAVLVGMLPGGLSAGASTD